MLVWHLNECAMAFFCRRRWRTISGPYSSMFGMLPCISSIILYKFVITTRAFHPGRYSLHLLLLKSSSTALLYFKTFYILLWSLSTWLFKVSFRPNDFLQIKHENDLISSRTVWTCLFKVSFRPNDCLQIKHENDFIFSCTVLLWKFKLAFCPNDFLQIKHECC